MNCGKFLLMILFCGVKLCSSPRHQVENTEKTPYSRKSEDKKKPSKEINETVFICMNGETTLKCDDGNHDSPLAVYYTDTHSKQIVSNVRGRIKKTSDARYEFSETGSTLLIRNLSKDDDYFRCTIVYKNLEITKHFNLKEYGTPKHQEFEDGKVDRNGAVSVKFTVTSFFPNNSVNVDCELNSKNIATNQQITSSDNRNFHLTILMTIKLGQNLTCTVSGPAMCGSKNISDYYFNQKSESNKRNSVIIIIIAFLCFAVVGGISACIYKKCCVQSQQVDEVQAEH